MTEFEEIYNRYPPQVFRVCMGYINDFDLAMDLTQETFMSVWRNLSSFKLNIYPIFCMAGLVGVGLGLEITGLIRLRKIRNNGSWCKPPEPEFTNSHPGQCFEKFNLLKSFNQKTIRIDSAIKD